MQTPSTHPLKQYREEHKVSQAKVARQLGVTQGIVAHWEHGIREISTDNALIIEERLNIPAEKLCKTFIRYEELKARRPRSQVHHEQHNPRKERRGPKNLGAGATLAGATRPGGGC